MVELLRQKLIHSRNKVRRMSDYKYVMTSLIQRAWREFHERNEIEKNQRLISLLQRFIEKILYQNDTALSAALHQRNKNTHKMKYKQNDTTFQDFENRRRCRYI